MREKLSPWIAAIFCACLSLITVVGNLLSLIFIKGATQSGVDVVFYCFLPMCFYFVGACLSNLRKEHVELQRKFDALAQESASKNHAL